jgi:hypothetical protein
LAIEHMLRAAMHPGAPPVTSVIVAGVISFLAALFAFGLAPEEREVLRKLVARLRSRSRRRGVVT